MTRHNTSAVTVVFLVLLIGVPFWKSASRDDSRDRALYSAATVQAAQSATTVRPIDVRQFGAIGDGKADDTAAIQAAINAAGRAGQILLPKGRFRITSPLRITYGQNEINIVGEGEGSAIVPDLNPGTDACFILGNDNIGVYDLHFADFAIVGPANSCKYGIKQTLGAGCTFDRINLCCGATEYGYYGEGVISNTFNQCTVAGYQGGYPYARPAGGWHLKKHALTGCLPNANRWVHCSTQLQTTYGIHLEDAEGGSISGQLEFAGIADVYLKNCCFIDLGDSYSEGGAWSQIIENCSFINVNSYFGNGGNLDLRGSSNSWVNNSWFWGLRIDADSRANAIGPCAWVGTFPDLTQGSTTQGLKDSGWGTVYYPPLFYTPTGNPDSRANVYAAPYAPSEFHNLIQNSSMTSWDGPTPSGWQTGWGIAVAQTGVGCPNPNRHIASNAAKISNPIPSNDNSLNYSITDSNNLAPFLGRMVTFSAWLKCLDANATLNMPAIWATLQCPAGGDFASVASSSIVDENDVGVWRRHYTSFYVPTDCTNITLKAGSYSTFGETEFLFAEPCLMLGLYGQNGWIPGYGEFQQIQLGRHHLHASPDGIGVNTPDPTTVWDVNGVITLRKSREPASPGAGMVRIYLDVEDGALKAKGENGRVVVLAHFD
jgi:hypothetical protein